MEKTHVFDTPLSHFPPLYLMSGFWATLLVVDVILWACNVSDMTSLDAWVKIAIFVVLRRIEWERESLQSPPDFCG